MSSLKAAIIFIGTSKYADFFPRWKHSVDNHFLVDCEKTIFAFSDQKEKEYFFADGVVGVEVPFVEWPQATLYRYKFLTSISSLLSDFDYVFYLDADLYALVDIQISDIIKDDKSLVGVQHPGNAQNPGWHTLETNEQSRACVPHQLGHYGPHAVYHQGCFWGGSKDAVIEMAKTLNERIDDDLSRNVMAIWYDESHMNKYFLENLIEVNTVPFSYAFPEQGTWAKMYPGVEIKMIHAEKSASDYPRYPANQRPDVK
tara:strand:+ start:1220 stop:1990 length:771 start_codon:yes stop_codon:yes gene_type:complete